MEIHISEELLFIKGNEQGIRRMLQNLIKNGLDHAKELVLRMNGEIQAGIKGQEFCMEIVFPGITGKLQSTAEDIVPEESQ